MKLKGTLLIRFLLKYYVRLKTPTVFRCALTHLYLLVFKGLLDFTYTPEGDTRLSPFHIICQIAVQQQFLHYLKLLDSSVKPMLK